MFNDDKKLRAAPATFMIKIQRKEQLGGILCILYVTTTKVEFFNHYYF